MGSVAGVVVLAVLAGAALVRAWGLRRVRAGDRRPAPLVLFATLLIALLLTGVALWAATRSVWIGIPALIGALLLGGGWLRVALDAVRWSGVPGRAPDRMDRLAASMDGTYRRIAAALLGAGFAGLVALVLWAWVRGRL